MSELEALQREVGEWAEQAFPYSTVDSVLAHLDEEVRELLAEPSSGEEAADVFMLLLHLCHKQGISLALATDAKFAIIKQRQWGPPDERGVSHHIGRKP